MQDFNKFLFSFLVPIHLHSKVIIIIINNNDTIVILPNGAKNLLSYQFKKMINFIDVSHCVSCYF